MSEQDTHRALGRLEGEQQAVQRELEQMREDLADLKRNLAHVVAVLDQAKGSWRAMVVIGSIAATLSAGITALISHWRQ